MTHQENNEFLDALIVHLCEPITPIINPPSHQYECGVAPNNKIILSDNIEIIIWDYGRIDIQRPFTASNPISISSPNRRSDKKFFDPNNKQTKNLIKNAVDKLRGKIREKLTLKE